jgi:Icc-related predicted phosphoesterase
MCVCAYTRAQLLFSMNMYNINMSNAIPGAMKFLVLTDLHQKKSYIEWINKIIAECKPDFTLFLGDITDMGTSEDALEIINAINSKTYAIPGNCDPLDLPEKISDVATNMHGKSVEIGEYTLVGLGGSNITIFGTPFELDEDTIYTKLKSVSKEGMILMTHAPAFGVFDHIPNGMSVGSPAIKKIVEEYHPILALSGHIHEDRGFELIEGTIFCNPGAAKEGNYAIISINEGDIEVELRNLLD